jgi:hypothetical protein
MPYKCVVPGCNSNQRNALKTEGYIQLFHFPQEGPRRDERIRAIHRADWIPTNHSYVCVKHFHSNDLITVEKYKDKDGKLCEYTRGKPVLSSDAVPRIFPNLPGYLTDNRTSVKRKPPDKRRE